jgi:hypothetical protein
MGLLPADFARSPADHSTPAPWNEVAKILARVVVPAGAWLTGPIRLRSNIDLVRRHFRS